jgi:hypothetical protein
MQQWIKPLTGLLVVQLVLVVLLNASVLKGPNKTLNTSLLDPAPTGAEKIVIQAQDESPLTLVKTEDSWQLPDYYNLPANMEKLNGFLQQLTAFEVTWPEATTSEAQKRFEVADDKYQRKISLYYGGDTETPGSEVFLGTSPGYQKTHARVAGASEIYSVGFGNYDAAIDPATWFDQKLLNLDLDRIHRIETPHYMLEQIDGEWRLSNLGPEETINAPAVKVFVTQVANFMVEAVLTDDPNSAIAKRDAQITVKAHVTGMDEPVHFRLALAEGSGYYILKSSQSPLYFRLLKAQGDRLVNIERGNLVKRAEPTEDEPASEAPITDAPSSEAPSTVTPVTDALDTLAPEPEMPATPSPPHAAPPATASPHSEAPHAAPPATPATTQETKPTPKPARGLPPGHP